MKSLQLLTHSRMDTFKGCRKKHWFSYEVGLRSIVDGKALRMGSAFHDGLQALAERGFDAAIESIRTHYAEIPGENWDALEWQYEAETVERLLCGYSWRWANDGLEYVAKEMAFELPLRNPETGAKSTTFNLAGKIDGIVRVADGRMFVMEHKLLSEDLTEGAAIWRRLRVDHQISLYVLAARELGYAVDGVFYDVTRKPTIAPCPIPMLDVDGVKIVLDANRQRVKNKDGKSWRQTSDTEKGYVLQTRPMEPEEWGAKLIADVQERPDFYFVRREIPRLDADLEELRSELWDIQKNLRDAQNNGRWYRTCNKNTCGYCSYLSPCTEGWKQGDRPQDGFELVADVHPELVIASEAVPVHCDPVPSVSTRSTECSSTAPC